MKLELAGIRLPLQPFTLEVEATLTAAASGICGPSGAGKTSLLELIAGLRRPTAGRVSLDGETLTDIRSDARGVVLPARHRRIGYVPQDGALFPHLSVRGNLLYGRRDGDAPAAVIEVLGLGPLLDRSIRQLSGGERRRVALGRALAAGPRLLLLDEPLSGLDSALRERVLEHLRMVRDELGVPMLYVSHDLTELAALCTQLLVIERGRVVAHGPAAELLVPRPGFGLRATER
ncbi:MAG TPA: ATP-binding cassette domain-containing protein [Thermoanaerobaculia bacterium]|nr:ATP-binding cassette domain-containing protein [Thermoanaerobaculia bacterium]